MPQSYVSNNQHIVFSTYQRQRSIAEPNQKKLWGYLAGITKNLRCQPMAIGGIEDHVHLLIALPADLDIAEYVNKLKSSSSKWLKQFRKDFAWQKGYGSFSVSASNLGAVSKYIDTQAEHHKKIDSRAEFLLLLERHGVKFEKKFIE
jgi:putative transposase